MRLGLVLQLSALAVLVTTTAGSMSLRRVAEVDSTKLETSVIRSDLIETASGDARSGGGLQRQGVKSSGINLDVRTQTQCGRGVRNAGGDDCDQKKKEGQEQQERGKPEIERGGDRGERGEKKKEGQEQQERGKPEIERGGDRGERGEKKKEGQEQQERGKPEVERGGGRDQHRQVLPKVKELKSVKNEIAEGGPNLEPDQHQRGDVGKKVESDGGHAINQTHSDGDCDQGKTCELKANTDIFGHDIGNIPSSKPCACSKLCKKEFKDRARTFAWSKYNGGMCWCKNSDKPKIPKHGVSVGSIN